MGYQFDACLGMEKNKEKSNKGVQSQVSSTTTPILVLSSRPVALLLREPQILQTAPDLHLWRGLFVDHQVS